MAQSQSSTSHLIPRVGDVVVGRFKILRGEGLDYKVLDTLKGKVSSKHMDLDEEDRYALSHLPEFKHYQVTGISVGGRSTSASVTLCLLQHSQGKKGKGRRRTFQIKEKMKIIAIRGAIEKGDLDVYCTVFKLCGMEVLGDIRSLPKDPPILRVPEEVMDMICTYLDDKDLYCLRQVSSVFAHTFLPIQKLWTISELHFRGDISDISMIRRNGRYSGRERYKHRTLHPSFFRFGRRHQLFLRTTKHMDLYLYNNTNEDEGEFALVQESCTKLESLTVYDWHDDNESMNSDEITHLVSANRLTLKTFRIDSKYGGDFDFDLATISCCKELEEVGIWLRHSGRVYNLEALTPLKDNLKIVYFHLWKRPLKKDQVAWISRNLLNIKILEMDMLHNCHDKEDEEIDEQTILSILGGNRKLEKLEIYFRFCTEGTKPRKSKSGRWKRHCRKASRIRKQVMRILQENGKSSEWLSDLSNFQYVTVYSRLEHHYAKISFKKTLNEDGNDDEESSVGGDDFSRDSTDDEDEVDDNDEIMILDVKKSYAEEIFACSSMYMFIS